MATSSNFKSGDCTFNFCLRPIYFSAAERRGAKARPFTATRTHRFRVLAALVSCRSYLFIASVGTFESTRCCIQSRRPQHRKDTELTERVQRRDTKGSEGRDNSAVNLKQSRLFSLDTAPGRPQGTFQYLKELQQSWRRTFPWACSNRTRGSGFKLKEGGLRLDMKKKSFTVVHETLGEVVNAPSLKTSKVWGSEQPD